MRGKFTQPDEPLWRKHVAPTLSALLIAAGFVANAGSSLKAQDRTLGVQALVYPSTVFYKDGQVVKFALHGFLEFQSLDELFAHIDQQVGRWRFSTIRDSDDFAADLLRRGLQSRVVSMQYEKPLELLVTHTSQELAGAIRNVKTPSAPLVFKGEHWQLTPEAYQSGFLKLQEHWKSSLNCWSASPVIAARVLSNWYIIDEGIALFGARYDSTEHFWQAVKYHPEIRLNDLLQLLSLLDNAAYAQWLEKLANDQNVYLRHTYALEFLRNNVAPERRRWFRQEVARIAAGGNMPVRALQQRQSSGSPRFTAQDEKVLWGDLADVFHLLYFFAGMKGELLPARESESLMDGLRRYHFDAVYLQGYGTGKMGFISPEFRQLMLEIWKVKYLEMKRFGEVIRSTKGIYLDHFLNDGDSPDIPIPVYVGFLNRIREMALQHKP